MSAKNLKKKKKKKSRLLISLRLFQTQEAEKEQEKSSENQFLSILGKIKGMEKLSGLACNCCNLAKCLWCPKPAPSEETIKFEAVLAKLEEMEEKVYYILYLFWSHDLHIFRR